MTSSIPVPHPKANLEKKMNLQTRWAISRPNGTAAILGSFSVENPRQSEPFWLKRVIAVSLSWRASAACFLKKNKTAFGVRYARRAPLTRSPVWKKLRAPPTRYSYDRWGTAALFLPTVFLTDGRPQPLELKNCPTIVLLESPLCFCSLFFIKNLRRGVALSVSCRGQVLEAVLWYRL